MARKYKTNYFDNTPWFVGKNASTRNHSTYTNRRKKLPPKKWYELVYEEYKDKMFNYDGIWYIEKYLHIEIGPYESILLKNKYSDTIMYFTNIKSWNDALEQDLTIQSLIKTKLLQAIK